MTIDDQIKAFPLINAKTLAILAGYQRAKQFDDYRAKGRIMNEARLEKLAKQFENMAATARGLVE